MLCLRGLGHSAPLLTDFKHPSFMKMIFKYALIVNVYNWSGIVMDVHTCSAQTQNLDSFNIACIKQ